MQSQILTTLVKQITREAEGINTYVLVDPRGGELPPFTAGAHVDVRIPGGFMRQYSLCNDPRERHRYLIGVLRDSASKGGSIALHDNVRAGDLLEISIPINRFELASNARRHLLLAGGIGITPMMAMMESLRAAHAEFVLHYCTRTPSVTAFRERLAGLAEEGRVVFHHDGGDPRNGLDIRQVLSSYAPGTHLYYCGPTGFMRAVKDAAAHWPSDAVHFEHFSGAAPVVHDPHSFTVKLARSGKTYEVPGDKSIVAVLRENGVHVDTSCEAGICGTCRTRYLEGQPIHNDFALTDAERTEAVMICCARAATPVLVLDL